MYKLPRIELLDQPAKDEEAMTPEIISANRSRLLEKLEHYNVRGTIEKVQDGPVITTYFFRPEGDVRLATVVRSSEDLAIALEVNSVRVDRAGDTGTIAIEVSKTSRRGVCLRSILETPEYYDGYDDGLRLALGVKSDGTPMILDLVPAPHLLIAGTTGSGKSVSLHAMLLSLLYRYGPDRLQLAMVDVKRVELGMYANLPHAHEWGVVNTVTSGGALLREIVKEINQRYIRMSKHGIVKADPAARRLVVVIDEFADLIMSAGRTVEDSVVRIAQLGRAAGVHLILATQRPTVNVVTGLIKANIHTRMCFQVSDKLNSRVVLDSNGAEKLLGKGDGLLRCPESHQPIRVHGAFVSEGDIDRVTKFISGQVKGVAA